MEKQIVNVGNLKGKILLFGGVYSNLQALETLVSLAKSEGIAAENCICTGDIVGYCAQPEETVQLFKSWGARSILGNVEEQLAAGEIDCGCDFKAGSRCDGFSKLWYPYAQTQLSKDSIEWMKTLPHHIQFQYANRKATVVHGSFNHISDFVFQSSPWKIKEDSLDATNCDLIVAGHCGLPFHTEKGSKLWINPGVIGMPANDGTPRVWYAILDDLAGFDFQHKALSYDHQKAHALMLERGLPNEYAKTLLTGIWDNMEILPETEKQLQGKEIVFETVLLKK